MEANRRPIILLIASTWYPLSVRLALALVKHGNQVSVLCPKGHPIRLVPGIRSIHRYTSFNSQGALKRAIRSTQPDILLPCDDGAVLQLHALHAEKPWLRPLIEYSLGSAEGFPILSNRGLLLQLASEHGIRIPETRAATSESDVASWPFAEAVVKVDASTGGEGTRIARSRAEIASAYRRLSRPVMAAWAIKRSVINRSPLSLWFWRRHRKPNVILQEFIPGTAANSMILCWRGEVLASVTVEVINSQGSTGAATVIRLIQHEEIERAACSLAQRLELNGFYGLDFILAPGECDGGPGKAYLIEVNPRCTQLGHLFLPGQGDLAGILSAVLQQRAPGPIDQCDQRAIQGNVVAFFPQALIWNPDSPYLYRGHHDVPWELPELVRELLQEEWPRRRLVSRLYHVLTRPFAPQDSEAAGLLASLISRSNREVHSQASGDFSAQSLGSSIEGAESAALSAIKQKMLS